MMNPSFPEREQDPLKIQNQANPERPAEGQPYHKVAVRTTDLLDYLVEVNPSLDGVALSALEPFDTILVQTLNSEYRIFMLDPKTGRSLVECGRHFAEPVEATVTGSTFGGSTLKVGWICVGLRLEFWTGRKWTRTSAVQSFQVARHS